MQIQKNKIQQPILTSIQTLIYEAIKKAGFDKTTTGMVIENVSDYKYQVVCNNRTLTLNCAVDVNIAVGNIVYITFPQGDINKAYISGIRRKS